MSAVQSTKLSQRERAIAATGQLAASGGYRQTTVAQIARAAGISRATFYEHFKDKQDCFLAAVAPVAERLASEVLAQIDADADAEPLQSAVRALVDFAEREPAAFALATYETTLAGVAGWELREELIEKLTGAVEAAWAAGEHGERAIDIPASVAIGTGMRVLGIHMRRGEQPQPLLAGLLEWLSCYAASGGAPRWRELEPCTALCEEDARASGPAPPQPPPRGRRRIPERVAKRLQHERILYAGAQAVYAKGQVDVSVAEITAAAGVSREVFYANFHDRGEALLEAQKMAFEQVMAACAGAFFPVKASWPERIWMCGHVASQSAQAQPALWQLAFVESHALGAVGVQREDDCVMAFTLFFEEGQRQQGARSSPVLAEAVVAAMIEVATFHLRRRRAEELPGLRALMGRVVLAPFIGAHAAGEFIDGKVREAEARVVASIA